MAPNDLLRLARQVDRGLAHAQRASGDAHLPLQPQRRDRAVHRQPQPAVVERAPLPGHGGHLTVERQRAAAVLAGIAGVGEELLPASGVVLQERRAVGALARWRPGGPQAPGGREQHVDPALPVHQRRHLRPLGGEHGDAEVVVLEGDGLPAVALSGAQVHLDRVDAIAFTSPCGGLPRTASRPEPAGRRRRAAACGHPLGVVPARRPAGRATDLQAAGRQPHPRARGAHPARGGGAGRAAAAPRRSRCPAHAALAGGGLQPARGARAAGRQARPGTVDGGGRRAPAGHRRPDDRRGEGG